MTVDCKPATVDCKSVETLQSADRRAPLLECRPEMMECKLASVLAGKPVPTRKSVQREGKLVPADCRWLKLFRTMFRDFQVDQGFQVHLYNLDILVFLVDQQVLLIHERQQAQVRPDNRVPLFSLEDLYFQLARSDQ